MLQQCLRSCWKLGRVNWEEYKIHSSKKLDEGKSIKHFTKILMYSEQMHSAPTDHNVGSLINVKKPSGLRKTVLGEFSNLQPLTCCNLSYSEPEDNFKKKKKNVKKRQ